MYGNDIRSLGATYNEGNDRHHGAVADIHTHRANDTTFVQHQIANRQSADALHELYAGDLRAKGLCNGGTGVEEVDTNTTTRATTRRLDLADTSISITRPQHP